MIKTLETDGFRLLNKFKADFGRLTVIVGANSTGKSSILDCLNLFSRLTERPFDEVFGWYGGASLLTAESDVTQLGLKLTFDNAGEAWSQVPVEAGRELSYELKILGLISGPVTPLEESLYYSDVSPTGTGEGVFLKCGPGISLAYSGKEKKLAPFDEAVGTKNSAQESGAAPPSQPPQQPRLRLAQMYFFNDYPLLSWTRSVLSRSRMYPGFDVGKISSIRRKPAEIKPDTTLYANGENLGSVLHEILTRYDYRRTAEDMRNFLRVAYPSFEEITAETAHGTPARVLVRLREKGLARPMELWDLSDGVLRFLNLMAALLSPGAPSFVSVDEPEIGLHPKLLPIIADMIKTASERTQVIVTTHSPDLLNCFGIDDVAVVTREGSRAAWLRPGTMESLRMMLESVTGETLGDLHRSGELEAIS